jgi:hypothetical protein
VRANYGGTDSGSNGTDFSVSTPTPRNASAYDAWRGRTFSTAELASSSISGDLASPSGDGMTNLEKYAFNLNPHKVDKSLAVSYSAQASGSTRTLTLSHRKSHFAKDLSYSYEVSSDLKTWSTGGTSIPATTVSDSQTDRVSVSASSATGRALFMRVRVVHY